MDEKKFKVIFFGTPDFAVPSLVRLFEHPRIHILTVVTQPDQPKGRHQELTASPVKREALARDIPVLQPERIRTPEFERTISDLAADVAIVVAYGKIVPENLLALLPHGWINVHASLLPKLRGASPIQHAVLQGLAETGVTIMQIEPALDTGPILAQQRTPIGPRETAETLHDTLSHLGADLLPTTLIDYLDGKIQPVPQNNTEATECKTLSKTDGHINWQDSAEQIERQIRAYTPWPGAFTTFQEGSLKIHSANPLSAKSTTPGTLAWEDGHLIVHTASHLLEILKLQPEGKRTMSAKEFYNGYAASLPAVLG